MNFGDFALVYAYTREQATADVFLFSSLSERIRGRPCLFSHLITLLLKKVPGMAG